MANRIKRASIFIEMTACTNSVAFKSGESVGVYKDELGHWITMDASGKNWRNLPKDLRNESYYEFVNQYSMPDIIYYLMDRNADYQTVMVEALKNAVETTFKEARVTCVDDIYKYIMQHLI